jgi:hypothetical protein
VWIFTGAWMIIPPLSRDPGRYWARARQRGHAAAKVRQDFERGTRSLCDLRHTPICAVNATQFNSALPDATWRNSTLLKEAEGYQMKLKDATGCFLGAPRWLLSEIGSPRRGRNGSCKTAASCSSRRPPVNQDPIPGKRKEVP